MRNVRLRRYRFVVAMAGDRVLLAAACALCLCSCSTDLGCDLDGVTRDLGGTGLMDCGIARAQVSVVDDCAVKAFRARSTFRALYEKKDGSLQGVVHAAGDKYYAIRTATDGGDVESAECKGGSITTQNGRTFVQCDEPGMFTKACK
jgi:hypothetical protein